MLNRPPPWRAKLGLQRRIQLFAAAGLLGVILFFWVVSRHALAISTRRSLDNQLALARLVAASLDVRLNSALTLLEQTAAQPAFLNGESPQAEASLLHEAQLQLCTFGRRLLWLDTSGLIRWVSPSDPALLAQPYPHYPVVRSSAYLGSRVVSDLLWSPKKLEPYVLLAVSIKQSSGAITGVLVEEVPISQLFLEDVLEQVPMAGAHVDLVDRQGTILASSWAQLRGQKGDHTNQFTNLINEHEPVVVPCHQCHQADGSTDRQTTEEILAFAPLQAAPWGVAIRQPASEVLAPVTLLRRQMLLGGVLALAGMLLTSWWFVKSQIIRPFQIINQTSEQLAAGNLDVPVPQVGVDEVAYLTARLEQMRVRLEATLADHKRWNEALEEMVQERTQELVKVYEQLEGKNVVCQHLLGKVLTAQEEERSRLARELHDAIGQSLSAIIMNTLAMESNLPPQINGAREKLSNVRTIAAQALQDLRNIIYDLRPEELDDLGLTMAVRSQARKHLESAGVQVKLSTTRMKEPLPAEVEIAVFRIVQEAITNIARHAQATKATILLNRNDDRLVVRVEDNGVGFEPAVVLNAKDHGWGLRGMKERAALFGGQFYLESRPGQGTLILVEIPLPHQVVNDEQDPYSDSG